ncbi:MAG: hypothetical protein AMJ46_14115 [Latescibacteria bacterium DG_63]|nr:MAG: hypothetical protein AMJ46_14115 [Latescibacteria bacterium DG_63]
MYVARPTAASTAKRPVLGRCGKGRWAKIATPKAANVTARRSGWANNPVEPAAIQAAARPAIAATRKCLRENPLLILQFFFAHLESLGGLSIIS